MELWHESKSPSMNAPQAYEQKFAGFIAMIEDAKSSTIGTILIATPEVIGDNYEEICESLYRISKAELSLVITGNK